MIAKFAGESDSDGVVTCKVASVILEPHFALSPVRCELGFLGSAIFASPDLSVAVFMFAG